MPTNNSLYAQIGQSIQAARKEKGLTQEDLANLTDLSRPSIVNIEKGRQSISVHALFTIATALATDVAHLIPNTNELFQHNVAIPNSVKNDLTVAEQKWITSKLMEL